MTDMEKLQWKLDNMTESEPEPETFDDCAGCQQGRTTCWTCPVIN